MKLLRSTYTSPTGRLVTMERTSDDKKVVVQVDMNQRHTYPVLMLNQTFHYNREFVLGPLLAACYGNKATPENIHNLWSLIIIHCPA